MIKEFTRVLLTDDLPDYNLKSGDIGTVVLVHSEGKGYEVEFCALNGDTLGVVTLDAMQIRAAREGEVAHARMLTEHVA